MSKRLNIERQEKLEPERMEYAKKAITNMGYKITGETKTWIRFYYKECPIMFYPYSGWATGKSIKDGRGLQKLLNQLKL